MLSQPGRIPQCSNASSHHVVEPATDVQPVVESLDTLAFISSIKLVHLSGSYVEAKASLFCQYLRASSLYVDSQLNAGPISICNKVTFILHKFNTLTPDIAYLVSIGCNLNKFLSVLCPDVIPFPQRRVWFPN